MKLKSLFFVGALALSTSSFAQSWIADTITMGANYANDIYYSLKNDEQRTEPSTNWHLAFQMTPQGPYGNVSIFANHVQGGVHIYSTHLQAAPNFATFSYADTAGLTGTGRELFNSDKSWNYGAFNQMADASDPFDFSWGKYDMASHYVLGDSLYLVSFAGGDYKIWIQKYISTPADSVAWLFRIAKLDGTQDTTVKIYRLPAYGSRLFAYYDITNQTVLDREPNRPDWDLLFTRYKEYIPGAPGSPYYNVAGVLTNFDVEVAEIISIGAPADTTGFSGFTYSQDQNVIGSNWKYYDYTTNIWTITDSTYYFVKTKNTNEYWELVFSYANGATGGVMAFSKRLLGTIATGIQNVSSPIAGYHLAPNPAAGDVNIMVDSKEAVKGATLFVTDLNGKVVMQSKIDLNGFAAYKLNVANLSSGTYMVTVTNGSWKVADKLVVQH